MSYKIPGLVAESISQKLFDKILSKTLKPITQNITFYIKQDTGNDNTADGTENKPFRSLQRCFNYIKKNFVLADNTITIKFLADYTELNNTLFFRNFTNSNYGISPGAININGENFNIILGNIYIFNCYIRLFNLKIKNKVIKSDYLIQVVSGGLTLDSNINIEIENPSNLLWIFNSNRNSTITIARNININFIGNPALNGIVMANYQGFFLFNTTNTPKFILQGNANFNKATCVSEYLGFIRINGFESSGLITGRRYIATTNGFIDTFNGGAEAIVGSIEGTVEKGGKYF